MNRFEISKDIYEAFDTFELEDFNEYLDKKITQNKVAALRYLRKASVEAYAYVIKTDEIPSMMENQK